MRAFINSQKNQFLDAFGQKIILQNGADFRGIVESRPIVIEGSEGLIEDSELYFTASPRTDIAIGSIVHLELNDAEMDVIPSPLNTYTVYNIESDLSGMVNYYFRRE